MAEYTPTTEVVRFAYAADRGGSIDARSGEAFDRWLEAVKREAVIDYVNTKETSKIKVEFTNQPAFEEVRREDKEKAWNEGAQHVYEGTTAKCDFAKDGDPCPYNPYSKPLEDG